MGALVESGDDVLAELGLQNTVMDLDEVSHPGPTIVAALWANPPPLC
jgi:hypothetical protein